MYKIVSKNKASIKIGDILVDLGFEDDDYIAEYFNSDKSQLVSLPKLKEGISQHKVMDLHRDSFSSELLITISDDYGNRTFPVYKLTCNNGWDKVVILSEKEFLFLQLRQGVA